MPDPIDRQAFLNLCNMSIDNMYELEALGELLVLKGLLTKQEILTLAQLLMNGATTKGVQLAFRFAAPIVRGVFCRFTAPTQWESRGSCSA